MTRYLAEWSGVEGLTPGPDLPTSVSTNGEDMIVQDRFIPERPDQLQRITLHKVTMTGLLREGYRAVSVENI